MGKKTQSMASSSSWSHQENCASLLNCAHWCTAAQLCTLTHCRPIVHTDALPPNCGIPAGSGPLFTPYYWVPAMYRFPAICQPIAKNQIHNSRFLTNSCNSILSSLAGIIYTELKRGTPMWFEESYTEAFNFSNNTTRSNRLQWYS